MPAYFRPGTLHEALAIAAERSVTVLAGGTDVYPAKASRTGWGNMRHPDVLDISAIKVLRGISEEGNHFRLGALTTWSELRRAALPPAFGGYQAAAREIGGVQVQNRGTLVGNVCTASPAGDGIPCLLALDAEVELASLSGLQRAPIERFISGYRTTARRPDEIVTALLIPRPESGSRGRFIKLGARRYLVISIVMAAAVLTVDSSGLVVAARVAVGACTPVAKRMRMLETTLIGRPVAAAPDLVLAGHVSELAPIDDIRASGPYRREAALALVRDLLAGFADKPAMRAA